MSAESTPMSDAAAVSVPTEPVSTPQPAPPTTITPDGIDTSIKKAEEPAGPPHPLEQRGRRHRPKDIATPADTPKIRELSAILKELTPLNDDDAPRVRELKSKFRAALDLDAEPAKPQNLKSTERTSDAPVAAIGDFTKPEPTIDQFADKDDPYGAHQRALAKWDREKEAHEAKVAEAKQQSERVIRESIETFNEKNRAYAGHLAAFKATAPDYDAVLAEHAHQGTPLLFHALLDLGETGPKVTYDLMKHPTLLDELILITEGKAITSDAVASTQRILKTRLATGSAGAVAPSVPIKVAPKPPSPARTGPMTPSDKPPGDDADLDEHRRFYGVGGRRHRSA